MAVDFSQLTRKKVGEAKRPPALPAGNYQGIVKAYEFGDNNQNHTPYVRYAIALTGAPEDGSVDEGDLEGIDLTKRQMRRDFFLTDEADWRLAEFLKSCGLSEGLEFEEAIPQVVGMPVLVEVQQYLNQRTNEIGNQIGALKGA